MTNETWAIIVMFATSTFIIVKGLAEIRDKLERIAVLLHRIRINDRERDY